ncbi:MAG: NADH dehydrogenase FAD-containing subunit [Actinobacteria bacterium]|jgi:hydrogenase-4 component F|nr:NADH dehydrogenase FAD-containing subunit [Actinomycetota bacterium]MCL6095218.1 NADH dehydrogenase FAD-containing subunit [Actinomycetota bacterium]
MVQFALVVIFGIPILAAIGSFAFGGRFAAGASTSGGVLTFAACLSLIGDGGEGKHLQLGPWISGDALSVVFTLVVGGLYAGAALYSVGYLAQHSGGHSKRFTRRYYLGLNIFCWAMVVAPLVNGLALIWVAIEITTVVSALLVAADGTESSAEAAWKYLLIASMGLGIALLGTIIAYAAGALASGHGLGIGFTPLFGVSRRMSPDMIRFAFVLAVLGYGTKMGLAPVHTWLPDAHSEAPTPISALLSGALLAVSFYAILRYWQLARIVVGAAFCRDVLLGFGILSLLLASLYLLSQRDIKRMFAYSSIEHMGIVAIGMSFAAPIAITGVLLQVLSHAAAKGTAFFGAGVIKEKMHTKDISKLSGGMRLLPWSGPLLMLAVLALSALPPFGIFRSEFMIVAGGLQDSKDVLAAVLIVFVTLAFLGISWSTTKVLLIPPEETEEPITNHFGMRSEGSPLSVLDRVDEDPSNRTFKNEPISERVETVGYPVAEEGTPDLPAYRARRGEISILMVVPMVVFISVLLLLGVHVPGSLAHLLSQATSELAGKVGVYHTMVGVR